MLTQEFAPYNFSKNGKVTGASTEVIELIFSRMGHKPVFLSLPWKRALQMIEEKEADGIYTYTLSPEREKAAYYSNPVSMLSGVFFKRKADKIKWETFSDLRPYVIGAIGGHKSTGAFKVPGADSEERTNLG